MSTKDIPFPSHADALRSKSMYLRKLLDRTPAMRTIMQRRPDGDSPWYLTQNLLLEFGSLRSVCPRGVYVAPTKGDPTKWSGIIFVQKGPYNGAILRFRISFPPTYPCLPPLLTFATDIFHPLVTPLTTYTYTTNSTDADTVSATDAERLPPGGFSLRHGFPKWVGRARQSGTSLRNVSGSTQPAGQHGDHISVDALSSQMEGAFRPWRRHNGPNDYTIIDVLRYIRSTFDNAGVLDSIPLEASGNPGAWHAWRSHRQAIHSTSLSKAPSVDGTGNVHGGSGQKVKAINAQETFASPTSGKKRRPGQWNWEGVWEERVKRGIQASLSEAVLYGNASGVGEDDLIHFTKLDEESLRMLKEEIGNSVNMATFG